MKYPYFIVPAVEEYRKLDPGSEEAKRLSRLIAANIGDYASLRLILGIDPPEFARFYPDMEMATPSTMDTIDSFLDKFGKNLPEQELPAAFEGYVLEEEVPELKVPEEIGAEEEIPEVKVSEDIAAEEKVGEENIPDDKEGFGDLIRNRKYEEALQFIERQNLNNPQKSIYFAHQIRFIKKLIAIERYRKLTKG